MKLLSTENYHKVLKPLSAVDFNHFFAKAVVLQHVDGKIFVDNTEQPTVFYIFHPYGMGLLFGDFSNAGFINQFKEYCSNKYKNRTIADWVQVFPYDWNLIIENIQRENSAVEVYERLNFKLNVEKYLKFRATVQLDLFDIVETDSTLFEQMPGTVVPRFFWNNATEFVERSKGFSLMLNQQPVSTAFASFLIDNVLEIGIQTVVGMHGCGYSALTCCKLIDYCMKNNLEPVWSCKSDNTGSVKLAQKLGFEICRTGSYYKINF